MKKLIKRISDLFFGSTVTDMSRWEINMDKLQASNIELDKRIAAISKYIIELDGKMNDSNISTDRKDALQEVYIKLKEVNTVLIKCRKYSDVLIGLFEYRVQWIKKYQLL